MNATPTDTTRKGNTSQSGKAGAPKANRNALRHGLRAGQLPADAKYIEHRLNAFRRQLEDAVVAAKGEVSIEAAGCIQTALRWERHAALAQRWLNKSYSTLKPIERLTFSREIARASGERDKALKLLGLDHTVDPFAELYAKPKRIEHVPAEDDHAGDLEDK